MIVIMMYCFGQSRMIVIMMYCFGQSRMIVIMMYCFYVLFFSTVV